MAKDSYIIGAYDIRKTDRDKRLAAGLNPLITPLLEIHNTSPSVKLLFSDDVTIVP